MDVPKSEIVGLIYQLLPGFIAAWIFYGLTAHPQKSPFERTIQALIFTGIARIFVIIIRASLLWVGSTCGQLGTWTENVEFGVSVLVGVVLGFIFSTFANTNKFHSWLPDWVTKRTSYPSEWFSAFNGAKRYVYLHLTGQRRIYGWPLEWPDSPGAGHFVLMQSEWILDDNSRAPLLLTERILIPAVEVVMVEFEKDQAEWTFDRGQQLAAVNKLIQRPQEQDLEPPPNDYNQEFGNAAKGCSGAEVPTYVSSGEQRSAANDISRG